MAQSYSQAKREANSRYDAKTYKKIGIALRVDDDKHIIEDFEKAKREGQTSREWLNDLFLKANK